VTLSMRTTLKDDCFIKTSKRKDKKMTTSNFGSLSVIDKRKAVLSIAMVVLVVINFMLIQQNRALKTYAGTSKSYTQLQPETMLPPLDGTDPDGKKVSVGYEQENRKTLMLVFSPRCRACNENMPNWQALLKKIDRNAYRVVAVSLMADGAGEYLERYGIDNLITIAEIDPADKATYNLTLTPQTVLIDSDGKAEKVWLGILGDEKIADIERTLNVR
jgi:hypothetical protein